MQKGRDNTIRLKENNDKESLLRTLESFPVEDTQIAAICDAGSFILWSFCTCLTGASTEQPVEVTRGIFRHIFPEFVEIGGQTTTNFAKKIYGKHTKRERKCRTIKWQWPGKCKGGWKSQPEFIYLHLIIYVWGKAWIRKILCLNKRWKIMLRAEFTQRCGKNDWKNNLYTKKTATD